MGSAQLDFATEQELTGTSDQPRPSALRLQAAERLAEHRQRRGQGTAGAEQRKAEASRSPLSPKQRVAAAVAERYAQTPSYRAILAEQARLAIQEAAAAAEVAVRNAEAVALAQHELLGELELWNAPQAFTPATARVHETVAVIEPEVPVAIEVAAPVAEAAAVVQPVAGLTVRLYEDLRQLPPSPPSAAPGAVSAGRIVEIDPEEARALDAEIVFRKSPVFEDYWLEEGENEALPANLLEFPRQLVAARKARPRLAEGPLREDTPLTAQLRIFEVEPDQIARAPQAQPAAPEWTSSIRLEAHTVTEPVVTPDAPLLASMLPPQAAGLEMRFMSGLVDAILTGFGTLAFVAAYVHAEPEIPTGWMAAGFAVAAFALVHIAYQLLFFTLSDQTPGMRYAQIGLCTFTDENPTRAAMRRRIFTQLLAIVPLGIGLLWIAVDEDGLGWHDRMSRMYQRSY